MYEAHTALYGDYLYYMVPHVCSLSRKCKMYRPDLRVVFLHEFSTDSLLSIYFMRIYCLTSSVLGLDDTVGNFEVSNC